jgi:hypothetical protein
MTDYSVRGGLSSQLMDPPWSAHREPRELTEKEMREGIEDAIEEMDAGEIRELYDHLSLEGLIEPK